MNVFKLIEDNGLNLHGDIEHFAELIRQEEREKVAAWMMARGYATGHGDTTEDLLKELAWQIAENWKWVGLTDEERDEIISYASYALFPNRAIAISIEAKLKEKNGG
jgi:hypothetical protein